jgi:predicted phosphoserine aminotransferase
LEHETFFFPGPTQVRKPVLEAMTRDVISHRSPAFREMFAAIQVGLQEVFRTARPVYVATASGTAMMEAAIRCAPPGKLLALVNGGFARRFADIARACHREVDEQVTAAGDSPDPGNVASVLATGSYSAVTVVHNETSTGVVSDVQGIGAVVRAAGARLIVDSVSGAGGTPLETDAWGTDCVVSASQKALAAPPGLAFAVASQQFMEAAARATDRGIYLDLLEYEKHVRNNETPTTPAVSLLFALATQLAAIRLEGIDVRWARHELMRLEMERWVSETRESLDLDMDILAKPGMRSPTVTVVTLPAEIDGIALAAEVNRRGYTIGTGYGVLRATTFRVGHMGDHTVGGLNGCLGAIRDSLRKLQHGD